MDLGQARKCISYLVRKGWPRVEIAQIGRGYFVYGTDPRSGIRRHFEAPPAFNFGRADWRKITRF